MCWRGGTTKSTASTKQIEWVAYTVCMAFVILWILQQGKTALILAAEEGHEYVVCSLLETGDNIDIDYQTEVPIAI